MSPQNDKSYLIRFIILLLFFLLFFLYFYFLTLFYPIEHINYQYQELLEETLLTKEAVEDITTIHPGASVLSVSARTGEGLDAWLDWLRAQVKKAKEAAR